MHIEIWGWDVAANQWRKVLVDAQGNVRAMLYDGVNPIDSELLSATSIADALRGLVVNSALRLSHAGGNNWTEWRAAVDMGDANPGVFLAPVTPMGYNGATWDRLRTDGLGVLKVSKGDIQPARIRMTATGRVGVAGAKKLFWIACSPDSPAAEWEISDSDVGGAAIEYDHFDSDKHSEHIDFNPPVEFATGIWVEKFDHMKSLVFCYI